MTSETNNSSVSPVELASETAAEKLREITDKLERGVEEYFHSDKYKELLRVLSEFHSYSVNNLILIAMQKPDASYVAGYTTWKNKFGRNVKKGERGIKIIAPAPIKRTVDAVEIDPVTNGPVLDEDGNEKVTVIERIIPMFKVVSVFDLSQTEGKEIPSLTDTKLVGDVMHYDAFADALRKVSPVPISYEDIHGEVCGYYSPGEKRIAIKDGMSEIQTFKTTIHEIAHAILHDPDSYPDKKDMPDNNTREVQAESVAYTVCCHYGIDTSDYSFRYVAGWSRDRKAPELKASLETIRSVSAKLMEDIDKSLELSKTNELSEKKKEVRYER